MLKSSLITSSLITMALLATSQAAIAQPQLPSAGGQLQQIPPPPAPEKVAPDLRVQRRAEPSDSAAIGPSIRVNVLHVTGETLFPEAELVAASGFSPGSDLTLSQLRGLASKISGFYNSRGYFVAQAYLPQQDIKNGIVTIAVVEGRYGKIDLRNRTNLSGRVARDALAGLDSNDTVATAPLERRLLLLSDIPGIRVRSTLAPGAEVGTSDLLIDLAPGRRVTGSVEADNGGNRYTGTYRLGGTLYVNDPAGLGDLVTLRLLASSGGLAYGRVAYQLPVGNATFGAAYTHVRYQLGREFKSLDADGTADIFSLFASYPLIRTREANLYLLAGADAKQLTDRIGLVSARSDKSSRELDLGVSGDSHDGFGGGGWNVVSLGWTFGNLDIKSPVERAADALTARSQGNFDKIVFSAARLQNVSGPLSLYGAIRGQLAFDNLESSEKMELGGAYAVRAYPEGEAYGDQGYVATIEARLALGKWAALPGRLQLIGFVDVGEVEYARNPWIAGPNRARRSGAGAGLDWTGPNGLEVKVTYAHRLGNTAVTSEPDKAGRAWFQIVKLF
jgi:hemolysin activation/secretion protein